MARLFFVGIGPGEAEANTGVPFVGPAGKKLDQLLKDFVHVTIDDVYITNCVKYRTDEGNREPTTQELQAHLPYLFRQVDIIQPTVIVAMGNLATEIILKEFTNCESVQGMNSIHGLIIHGKKRIITSPCSPEKQTNLQSNNDKIKRNTGENQETVEQHQNGLDSAETEEKVQHPQTIETIENVKDAKSLPKNIYEVIIFPVFHPAAVLHQPRFEEQLQQDFTKLGALIQQHPFLLQDNSKVDFHKIEFASMEHFTKKRTATSKQRALKTNKISKPANQPSITSFFLSAKK